jgi:hypothetical protein
MIIPDINDLDNSNKFRQNFIKNHYPEFYKYLINKYKEVQWNKFSELLYLYFYDLSEPPKCPVCGNVLRFISFSEGYHTYCSAKCMSNSNEVINRRKQTCIKKYGVENPSLSDEIKQKKIQTSLKHYGVEHTTQAKEVKEKIKQTNLERYGGSPLHSNDVKNKFKNTCLKLYGVENPSRNDEIKQKKIQTSLKHYGVEIYSQSKEYRGKLNDIMSKSISTKKKNHSLNESKLERDFKIWLDKNHISYIYQYKSDKYLFNCDFYFPNKDIYLEIQGYWHHGPEPYDPSNPKHQEILNKLIERSKNSRNHSDAINIWTIRDPMKRKIAQEHHLNFIEVFTYDINILINKVKDIL